MRVEWREHDGVVTPFYEQGAGNWEPGIWAAQRGSQDTILSCPIFELLIHGDRGGGKTDVLIMDFAQHVGLGFRDFWKGILFRRTFPELSDIIAKTKHWFPRIFPSATYNEANHVWRWPQGESLQLSYMDRPEHYSKHHGHAYPWMGWEELTTYPDDKCYRLMMSCSRSSRPGMPRKIRNTTNPYGRGHNWVKARWNLPHQGMIGPTITEVSSEGIPMKRVAIECRLRENLILMAAEPDYRAKIEMAARNPQEMKAWLENNWDIVSGGMFDDIWNKDVHIVPNIPLNAIPAEWKTFRGYDHGQSKPFSVGWWAQSNGEPIEVEGRTLGGVPEDRFRVAEWYGWNGSPNEGVRMGAYDIGRGIVQRENQWGMVDIRPGPADASIFDDYEPGKSVAGDMRRAGVRWEPCDKRKGSRTQGWEQMRKMLRGALSREEPGLFVCKRCTQFIRTVPVLCRSDSNPDDVDTETEDHVGDEVRYVSRHRISASKSRSNW